MTNLHRATDWERPKCFRALPTLLLWAVLAPSSTDLLAQQEKAPVVPLPLAHAHNDYLHARPLLDALDRGFCSVEADIFLVDGKLLVAHERLRTSPERTLEALYLDPLAARARANAGRVYRGGPVCLLLIDLKTEAEATYAALHKVLERYTNMLTSFHRSGGVTTNAITVIVSGNRPRQTMAEQSVRYAGFDGRVEDLDSNAPLALIPLISDNWTKHFRWRGRGDLPAEDAAKLKTLVTRTHDQGRWLRLWGAPDESSGWSVLHAAGVDLINTDNLDGLKSFLLSAGAERKPGP
jgi:hypothetical protein